MIPNTSDAQVESAFDQQESDPIRFTYSRPEHGLLKRAFIRAMERMSGASRLERMYLDWAASGARTENFFDAAVRLLELDVRFEGALAEIPARGPVLFVANHPFGVVDGLVLGHLAQRCRPDMRIVTHSLLCKVPQARNHLLPIDFGTGREAQATTVATRRAALDWLQRGHSVGIFPAGSVSTAQDPLTGRALEGPWHPFATRLGLVPDATVIPVFFHGENSRLFHMVSHLNYTLRVALLFRESMRLTGGMIRVTIGSPMRLASSATESRQDLARQMRRATLQLGGARDDIDAEFVWPHHIRFD